MKRTLDLTKIGLAERNTVVARRFDDIDKGDILELVTDSPPWVLYHQLTTDRLGDFEWQLVDPGPDHWVVHITRLTPAARA